MGHDGRRTRQPPILTLKVDQCPPLVFSGRTRSSPLVPASPTLTSVMAPDLKGHQGIGDNICCLRHLAAFFFFWFPPPIFFCGSEQRTAWFYLNLILTTVFRLSLHCLSCDDHLSSLVVFFVCFWFFLQFSNLFVFIRQRFRTCLH